MIVLIAEIYDIKKPDNKIDAVNEECILDSDGYVNADKVFRYIAQRYDENYSITELLYWSDRKNCFKSRGNARTFKISKKDLKYEGNNQSIKTLKVKFKVKVLDDKLKKQELKDKLKNKEFNKRSEEQKWKDKLEKLESEDKLETLKYYSINHLRMSRTTYNIDMDISELIKRIDILHPADDKLLLNDTPISSTETKASNSDPHQCEVNEIDHKNKKGRCLPVWTKKKVRKERPLGYVYNKVKWFKKLYKQSMRKNQRERLIRISGLSRGSMDQYRAIFDNTNIENWVKEALGKNPKAGIGELKKYMKRASDDTKFNACEVN